MKKYLPTFIFISLVALSSASAVSAQVSTSSATSSSTTKGGTTSSEVVLPSTLPETGSHDLFFALVGGGFLITVGLITRTTLQTMAQESDQY